MLHKWMACAHRANSSLVVCLSWMVLFSWVPRITLDNSLTIIKRQSPKFLINFVSFHSWWHEFSLHIINKQLSRGFIDWKSHERIPLNYNYIFTRMLCESVNNSLCSRMPFSSVSTCTQLWNQQAACFETSVLFRESVRYEKCLKFSYVSWKIYIILNK